MNLDQPLHAISSALSDPDGQSPPIGPGRWHVLFGDRQRPLLMPAASYRLQKKCLEYFIVDNHLKSLCARALLKANSMMPHAGLLPEFRLPRARRATLPCELPFREPSIAVIQIGTSGPYQKASVLLMSERGQALAMAKIAMMRSADGRVTAEAGWLKRLAVVPKLAGRVPRLLAEGKLASGRRYLVCTLAPTMATINTFTPAHGRFLGVLGRTQLEVLKFRQSPCLEYLERTLSELESCVTREDRMALQMALRDCRLALSDFSGPFVIAQGDFAPWNIRVQQRRIFVFDWEYAKAGANPLADAINYLLIQRAAVGRGVGTRFLANVMRRVEEIAVQLYPEWRMHPRVISALTLAYLLEVVLCYSASVKRLELRHPVITSYWELIERRRAWMAA